MEIILSILGLFMMGFFFWALASIADNTKKIRKLLEEDFTNIETKMDWIIKRIAPPKTP